MAKITKKSVQFHLLSDKFYTDYDITIYNQILDKGDKRGYGVFLIPVYVGFIENEIRIFNQEEMKIYVECNKTDIFEKHNFAIPLHSNIKATSGFILQTTHLSQNYQTKHSGLDYNKAVIVKPEHLGRRYNLERPEFNRINSSQKVIQKEFSKFLNNYIKLVKEGNTTALKRDFNFTTLQYFHEELKLNQI
ncbi:hypothetical protein [Glaesserella sp.]|uniref:hypothetical protein n=1 Tax=Glaesserella sp. TaxID=2094731 RepID=UPI0035A0AFCC